MADRETLRVVVAEGMSRDIPFGIERDVPVAQVGRRASVIIGPRRCGKTYRMYQHARQRMSEGAMREQILFVDFEDDRLFPLGDHAISDVVDEYFAALNRIGKSFDKLFLYFDEVHNAPEWARQIRRLLDSGKFEIIVSGSSAKMLSIEIATEFKGRGVATEMFPLSFREYLRFRKKESLAANPSSEERAVLIEEFVRYLRVGGFPEIQDLDDCLRTQLQQELVDVVVMRDICERHNMPVLGASAFVRQALRTSGREFSVSKTYNALKSMHVPIARDDAYALPAHCEDAYLFFMISQLSRSYRVQKQGTRKLYAVDSGLQHAVSPASVDDEGQRFEDAVFVQLKRGLAGSRDGTISTLRTSAGREIDFALGDASEGLATRLIQVSVEVLSPETAKREYEALTSALDETGLSEAEVVVFDAMKCLEPEDERINVISAWEWFLR